MSKFLDVTKKKFDAVDMHGNAGSLTIPVGDEKEVGIWDVDGIKTVKPIVGDNSLVSVTIASPKRAPAGKKGEVVVVTLKGLKPGQTAVTFKTIDDKKKVDKGDQLDVVIVPKRTVYVNLFVSNDLNTSPGVYEKLFRWINTTIYSSQAGITFQLNKTFPIILDHAKHGLNRSYKTADLLMRQLLNLANGRNPDRYLNVFIVTKWGGLHTSGTKGHVADSVWQGKKNRCCVCVWDKGNQNIGLQIAHELGHLLLLDFSHANISHNVMLEQAGNKDLKIDWTQAVKMHENLEGITFK